MKVPEKLTPIYYSIIGVLSKIEKEQFTQHEVLEELGLENQSTKHQYMSRLRNLKLVRFSKDRKYLELTHSGGKVVERFREGKLGYSQGKTPPITTYIREFITADQTPSSAQLIAPSEKGRDSKELVTPEDEAPEGTIEAVAKLVSDNAKMREALAAIHKDLGALLSA